MTVMTVYDSIAINYVMSMMGLTTVMSISDRESLMFMVALMAVMSVCSRCPGY